MYIVCNLTTQKYKVLPKPSGLSSRSAMRRGAYLAFDPLKSPHYKVVVGSHYPRSKREPWYFEIDKYNSESGNWKTMIPPDTCCGCGVFWSGAIYWLVSYKNVLMRFKVDAEEMTALPLRRRSLSKESMKYFGACCDGLIIIQTRSSSTLQLFTLELKSDTCWWILKYCMNLETIGSAFPEIEYIFKFNVLCVVKGEKTEDYAPVLAIPGNVITYNMEKNTLGVFHDLVLGEQINEVGAKAIPEDDF
ncbi:hypothetical protein RHSIM_Rhsim01G0018400 [Rhododendron simsii]|uniref:F-box associated beta-propeller type 3 domain-containing protein n=1 Tax=Rhododendron simsii TaxID=118357 RepID=A0A834HF77_RHOSS|nr:hypothetical protein RHSIM_Rhsim01G0018400 [Rhododendron simsii]